MSGRFKLDLDFRDVLNGLDVGQRVRSSDVFGAVEDVFLAREHNYRRIDDHTLLHVLNFEVGQPYSLRMARPDLICIQAIVSGHYNRWIGARMDIVAPQILQISNSPYSVADVDAGRKLRGILIICDRRYLVEHYQINVERLPAIYRPIFLTRTGMPEVLRLPLSSTGLHLVDQIISCRYQEPLRGIFVAAKTIEIICDVVSQLNSLSPHGPSRLSSPSQKLRAIESAADIYRREINNPPTIEQLARRVGLNRNELTSGFRDVFGVTPHAYAQMRRMEVAQGMLRDGNLSISEIARRIGYEGYSSFSRAYQAHFGQPPATGNAPASLEEAESDNP